jgi:hypothetical protein
VPPVVKRKVLLGIVSRATLLKLLQQLECETSGADHSGSCTPSVGSRSGETTPRLRTGVGGGLGNDAGGRGIVAFGSSSGFPPVPENDVRSRSASSACIYHPSSDLYVKNRRGSQAK